MVGMDFGTGMARDQPNDPLDLFSCDPYLGIAAAFAKAIEPQRSIGIDHDLDDLAVAHGRRDVGTERGDQHASAPFRSRGVCGWTLVGHHSPPPDEPSVRRPVETCRPTWVTKASNLFAPTARPAWSPSASGVWIASSKRMNSASVSRMT